MSNLQDIAGNAGTELAPVKQTPKKEIEALELEAKKLEVETLKLQKLEREANLQDLQERLAERELKRELKMQRSKTNGDTIKQLQRGDEVAQKRCNHKKGGNGANGVVGGQGDDSQYAVLKHTFANGDMWIRCLRCGKTWKPPIRSLYNTDEAYLRVVAEYEAAINFQTRNVPSASVQFRFSDNGEYYRKVTAATNLR